MTDHLSAEERAAKLYAYALDWHFRPEAGTEFQNIISSEIKQAESAAEQRGFQAGKAEGFSAGDNCTAESVKKAFDQGRAEGYDAGFNEAVDRAAKFMEQYGCTACNHFVDHDASPEIIRQLKPGER